MFEFNNKQKQSPGGVLKKGVLENFANFTGKNLCQSLFFFKKIAGPVPESLPQACKCIKKDSWAGFFLRILRNFWENVLTSHINLACLFMSLIMDLRT